MTEGKTEIEPEEIDYFGLHEVDAVVRVDGHRIPASLPYGFESWDEWWRKKYRPAWVNESERIPSHRVDQPPDPVLAEWNVFVAGVLVAHDYDGYVARDPLNVLPVAKKAITVRQCAAPGCVNVIHVLRRKSPPCERGFRCLSSSPRRLATASISSARSGGHESARPSIVVAKFLSQVWVLWVRGRFRPQR